MDWRWVFSGAFILGPHLLPFPNIQAKCTDCQKAESQKHIAPVLNFCWSVPVNHKQARKHNSSPGNEACHHSEKSCPDGVLPGPHSLIQCIFYEKIVTRLRSKEVKPWYVCLCWDSWVKVVRREKWKLELHQIRRTDKWLLSIGAVLRQLMTWERKDKISVCFLELGVFCLSFSESFMTCWNTVLHNSFSPSLLLSGFCSV